MGGLTELSTCSLPVTPGPRRVQPPRTGFVVDQVRANTLCLLGKAVVVIGANNADDMTFDLTYGTPYGQRVDTAVTPGEVSVGFISSKVKRIAGGTATVTATIDGVPLSQTYEVSYPGKRC